MGRPLSCKSVPRSRRVQILRTKWLVLDNLFSESGVHLHQSCSQLFLLLLRLPSTGTFVNNDFTSKLTSFMWSQLMSPSRRIRSCEFFKWHPLIVPRAFESGLASTFANLCGALPTPDVIGLMGMLGLVYFWKSVHSRSTWSLLQEGTAFSCRVPISGGFFWLLC